MCNSRYRWGTSSVLDSYECHDYIRQYRNSFFRFWSTPLNNHTWKFPKCMFDFRDMRHQRTCPPSMKNQYRKNLVRNRNNSFLWCLSIWHSDDNHLFFHTRSDQHSFPTYHDKIRPCTHNQIFSEWYTARLLDSQNLHSRLRGMCYHFRESQSHIHISNCHTLFFYNCYPPRNLLKISLTGTFLSFLFLKVYFRIMIYAKFWDFCT